MKYFIIFLFTFSLVTTQAQSETGSLEEMTQDYIDAYIDQDFDKLATMTHPNIISMSGSVDFVKKDIEADYKAISNMGFKYINGKVGAPGEVYTSGAELLCFIPQIFTIELNGDEYLSTSYVLATSMTKGKVWNFVSLERQDANSIGVFIPSYEERMGWPENGNMERIEK